MTALDAVRRHLERYVRPTDPDDLDTLALWAAHTWLFPHGATYTTPRLILTSSTPGSGKTTVLDHLSRLTHKPMMGISTTAAALFRSLADGPRTVMVDEVEKLLGTGGGADTRDLLQVINSGYRKGSTVSRIEESKDGKRVAEFPTFSPVVLAGNAPALADDTRQRSLEVHFSPDVRGEYVAESDWEMIESDVVQLGQKLASWVGSAVEAGLPPRGAEVWPDGIGARDREIWRPLQRLALAAGDDWPARVRDRMERFVHDRNLEREAGLEYVRPHIQLARDLATVWPVGESWLSSADAVRLLEARFPEVWGPLQAGDRGSITAVRFGRMLNENFRVRSEQVVRNGPRGFSSRALRQAWIDAGVSPSPFDFQAGTAHSPVAPVAPGAPVAP